MDSEECDDDVTVTPCQNLIQRLIKKPNVIQDEVPEATQVREIIWHWLICFLITFYNHSVKGQASKDYLGQWGSYHSWQHHWFRNIYLSKGSSHKCWINWYSIDSLGVVWYIFCRWSTLLRGTRHNHFPFRWRLRLYSRGVWFSASIFDTMGYNVNHKTSFSSSCCFNFRYLYVATHLRWLSRTILGRPPTCCLLPM